jgi:DNA polymerase III delta subunit
MEYLAGRAMAMLGDGVEPAGSGDQGQGPSAKKRTAKRRAPQTDLMIVKNPKNPYPVYQLFLNADNYTREELLLAFERLAAADLRLKSSGEKKRLILEQAIAAICRCDP